MLLFTRNIAIKNNRMIINTTVFRFIRCNNGRVFPILRIISNQNVLILSERNWECFLFT